MSSGAADERSGARADERVGGRADERATQRLDDGSLAALLRVGVVGMLLAGWGSGPGLVLSRWLEGVWVHLATGRAHGVEPVSAAGEAVSLGAVGWASGWVAGWVSGWVSWGPWGWWTSGLGALVLATGVSVGLAVRRRAQSRRTVRRWARGGAWRGPATAIALLSATAWAVRAVAGGARAGGIEASALHPLMDRWMVELAWVAGAWLGGLGAPATSPGTGPRRSDRSARGGSGPTS